MIGERAPLVLRRRRSISSEIATPFSVSENEPSFLPVSEGGGVKSWTRRTATASQLAGIAPAAPVTFDTPFASGMVMWIFSGWISLLVRSEEHTSELQSHSFISYAVFCL